MLTFRELHLRFFCSYIILVDQSTGLVENVESVHCHDLVFSLLFGGSGHALKELCGASELRYCAFLCVVTLTFVILVSARCRIGAN